MKKEEFDELVGRWSCTNQLEFLMQWPNWCDAVMGFVQDNWDEINQYNASQLGVEDVVIFAENNKLLQYTDIPEDDV
jgi:hypothetical protein